MRRSTASLVLVLALSACAGDKDLYPSLARRPAERLSSESPTPAPSAAPTPAAPAPELLARADRLLAQAREADAAFRAHEAQTRALVGAAKGSAVASESWSTATVALADLESARSNAMIALAELDGLYAQTAIAGGDTAALADVRGKVAALVGVEDDVLAQLRGAMPQ